MNETEEGRDATLKVEKSGEILFTNFSWVLDFTQRQPQFWVEAQYHLRFSVVRFVPLPLRFPVISCSVFPVTSVQKGQRWWKKRQKSLLGYQHEHCPVSEM